MPEPTLPRRAQRWLLAALLLVVLPHAGRLPVWITLFVLGCGALHEYLQHSDSRRLPRPLLLTLTAAGSGGVFLHYGTLLGRNAGVALLVVMLALKLLETRRSRDALLVIYSSYFVVVTNFLFTQTPLIALYMFAVSIVITAALSVITHDSAQRPATDHLRLAATLTLQALPVMAILFVLFPRVVGPLWGLPGDAHSAVTGLSDTMRPGTISRLVESGATAFRAHFTGPEPEPGERYWRGPVLWETDGRTWSTGRPVLRGSAPAREQQLPGAPLLQEITLEPHQRRWLPGLDRPVAFSIPAMLTAGSDWLATRAVRERIRYTVTSYTRIRSEHLNPLLRAAALQLPERPTPRLRDLAEGWRRAAGEREVVARALAYFHDEPFVYTLRPPLLEDNPVEEFLFDSRRGFCEHYAAAFVLLMRNAGIPARVVTGYQGGEYNPIGDYWLVRQSDAHAWAEVWLEGSGWERVDPTAAVAPERIEHALDVSSADDGAPARFRLPASGLLAGGWRALRYTLDTLNNGWNQWVLSYGPGRQRELLGALGFHHASWKDMALLLLLGVGTVLLALAATMFLATRRPADPVLAGYHEFCRRMACIGVERRPAEGPLDFSRRIIRTRPALASRVRAIIGLYIRLRYGTPAEATALRIRFRRLIRQLPRRSA
jgi:transglutaminase-like putative cysteine protease